MKNVEIFPTRCVQSFVFFSCLKSCHTNRGFEVSELLGASFSFTTTDALEWKRVLGIHCMNIFCELQLKQEKEQTDQEELNLLLEDLEETRKTFLTVSFVIILSRI